MGADVFWLVEVYQQTPLDIRNILIFKRKRLWFFFITVPAYNSQTKDLYIIRPEVALTLNQIELEARQTTAD